MIKKFAAIKLVNDLSEIPDRFGILDKTPGFILKWYINRFNPYTIEETEQFGEKCMLVRLPVTKALADSQPQKAFDILKRTISDVCDISAGIAVLDDDFPHFPLSKQSEMPVRIANGNGLFPFFIMDAISKSLSMLNKDTEKAEILIIPGERNLTLCLLDCIYPHVKNISLIPDGTAEYIFKSRVVSANPGRLIHVAEKSADATANADVIINLSDSASLTNDYRRRAVYFDLSGDINKLRQLLHKRGDMLIIDGLRFKIGNLLVNNKYFEAIFFAKSRNYRQLLNHGYDPELLRQVADELIGMKVCLSAFLCQRLLLSCAKLQAY